MDMVHLHAVECWLSPYTSHNGVLLYAMACYHNVARGHTSHFPGAAPAQQRTSPTPTA